MDESWVNWVRVTGGAVLIAAGLRDMFHTLFHPAGTGNLGSWVSGSVWRIFQWMARWRSSVLDVAGPAAMLTVIVIWSALQAFGWALVYWPFLPAQFRFATGIPEWAAQGRFVDSLYASLVTLATLGYGDISPTTAWLRLLAPLEALIGFAVLTAGLSWVLSTYPVLHRRNSFAYRAMLAARTHGANENWLSDELAEQSTEKLSQWRSDLRNYPITFYFRGGDSKSAFPVALALLNDQLRSTAEGRGPSETLRVALTDLTAYISERFLSSSEPLDAVIRHILDEHRWTRYMEELSLPTAEYTRCASESGRTNRDG